MKWLSGGPVAFLQYKDYNPNRIEFFCDFITSEGHIKYCPQLKLRKFSSQIEFQNNNKSNKYSCTLMLLRNFREPVWTPVDCDVKMLHFTICTFKEKTKSYYGTGKVNLSKLFMCKSINLLINNKCYGFLWNHYWNTTSQYCYDFKARVVSPSEFTSITGIFDAVSSVNFFPRFIFPSNLIFHIIKIYKLFNRIQLKHIKKPISIVSGFIPCKFNKVKIRIGINMFYCKKGGYILTQYVCDEHKDCPNDNSDEDFCMCNKDSYNMKKNILCKKLKSSQNITKCTSNYYMDKKGICIKNIFDPLHNETKMETSIASDTLSWIHLSADKSISGALTSDIDLGPKDKSISLAFRKEKHAIPCNYHEMPCMDVDMTCFNITEICLYKLSVRNELIPCNNGGHLENCLKFQCNMLFKCSGYYCIPWIYVCDGKWDCPYGEDEVMIKFALEKVYVKICTNVDMIIPNVSV